MYDTSVKRAPTQNRLPALSLEGQKEADFAPTFGSECIGSEIGHEHSLTVSSGAATSDFWTKDTLGCCVGSADGAGIIEIDPVHGVNGENAQGID